MFHNVDAAKENYFYLGFDVILPQISTDDVNEHVTDGYFTILIRHTTWLPSPNTTNLTDDIIQKLVIIRVIYCLSIGYNRDYDQYSWKLTTFQCVVYENSFRSLSKNRLLDYQLIGWVLKKRGKKSNKEITLRKKGLIKLKQYCKIFQTDDRTRKLMNPR